MAEGIEIEVPPTSRRGCYWILAAEEIKEDVSYGNWLRYGGQTIYSRTHDDGWKITGRMSNDFYSWVSWFEAVSVYGWVWCDGSQGIYASSQAAFDTFTTNHPFVEFDPGDI